MSKLPMIVCVAVAEIAVLRGKLVYDRRTIDHIVRVTPDADQM